jgi:NAD(P)-dependent dehydrogenase (short-subunit alcohol dehydrogenase family)
MKDFKNKVVVITGAGSGIGRATALAFAREGAKLYLTDINAERIEAVGREIQALGAEAKTYVFDSSNREAMERFAADVYAAAGRVDILHNNAGIGVAAPFESIPLDLWEKIINVNLWGYIYGIHYFLPRMIAQGGGGHIVNTASSAGLTAVPLLGAYNTTKFALVGLSETMSIELQKYGIYTPKLARRRNQIIDFYRNKGVSPERVARDVLKAVRKRRPLQLSPFWQVFPGWFLKKISVRAQNAFTRFLASKVI